MNSTNHHYRKNHIESAFARIDLKQIRSFILEGTETLITEDEPYKVRLDNCSNAITERLETIYPNREDMDKAFNELAEVMRVHSDVYLEMGMKFGARLLHQLLTQNDNN